MKLTPVVNGKRGENISGNCNKSIPVLKQENRITYLAPVLLDQANT
jgi:hypothetical protein